MRIDKDRWLQAQSQEIYCAINNIEELKFNFNWYFAFFGDTHYINNWKVAEIGCSTYPMASFFPNMQVTGVDPLFPQFNADVKSYWHNNNITSVAEPFEEWNVTERYDEVWFINCLQHVMDPDLCMEKAKSIADRVRVFEPIKWPTDMLHPHTFTMEFFEKHFPETRLSFYKGGTVPEFHESDCCYFVS
jgi:hypothetical protein